MTAKWYFGFHVAHEASSLRAEQPDLDFFSEEADAAFVTGSSLVVDGGLTAA